MKASTLLGTATIPDTNKQMLLYQLSLIHI